MKYLIALLALTVSTAFGADIITASVTVTNGTANGDLLTVNGSVRRWTNNVSQTIHIGTNSTAVGSATNLFRHFGSLAAANASVSYGGSNVVKFTSFPGIALTVVADGTWAEVSYATNALTNSVAVTVPWNVPAAPAQTNLWSGVVTGIGQNVVTSTVPYGAPAFAEFLSLVATQTVSGPKALTNRAGLWQGDVADSSITNATFRGTNRFGIIGFENTANGFLIADYAVGSPIAAFTNGYFTITGDGGFKNESGTLAKNAVLMDTTGGGIAEWGYLTTMTNANLRGSQLHGTNAVTGSIAYRRNAITTLANGANSVTVGTNSFVEVSGPSGAFTLNGLNASPNVDGHFLIVLNQTGQNMTVAHESGTEPTAGNRIVTMTGGDRATTGNGSATFIYSGAASRWICISFDP